MPTEWLLEMAILVVLILLSPVLSRVSKIPIIVIEIILGMIFGPSFLSILRNAEWLSTIATIGFIYLMFVVGLETEIEHLKANVYKVAVISMTSFLLPLILGAIVSSYYGLPELFIGVTLSTTSMGIVLPTVKEFFHLKEFSQVLLGSAIVADIISMFALAYVVESQMLGRTTVTILLLTIASFIVILYITRKLRSLWKFLHKVRGAYYFDIRISIALIFTFAIMAEFVGVHAIIGSFFAGLLISEMFGEVEDLIEKLLSFGYGFFIPIFFIAVGVNTDIMLIISNIRNIKIFVALLIVGYLIKIIGTSITSRAAGFNKFESLSIGFAMSARLSLVVAAAEIGLTLGLIDKGIYSILILLAIISVILSPPLSKLLIGKSPIIIREEEVIP